MDFWQRARVFAEEAARKSQEISKEAAKKSQELTQGAAKFSQEFVSETAKKSKELAAEASKKADQIKLEAMKRADQIKALAGEIEIPIQIPPISSLASQGSAPAEAPAAELERFGVTDELREFVKGITISTFRDFPMEDEPEISEVSTVSNVRQDLNEWQAKHATLVLSTVKEISKFRYELCPRNMKERKFWRIYFILVNNYVALEMKSRILIISLAFVIALAGPVWGQAAGLQQNFYKKTCPQAEQIVQKIVWNHVANNSELPAKLLRMFFHDCFVRGCDASILLDSANNTAEKDSRPNLSIAGFDVIDEVKTALELACPNTVSCADIVALATRDSVSFQFNESIWEVKTGRRDGRVSQKQEALANIPSPFSNFTTLMQSFANKSLDVQDLVVLSGAHTIGVGHCNLFSNRLYNFTGQGDADPSLNATYAAFLRTQCTQSDTTTTVPMDPGSGTTFDNHYFVILKQNQGMFQSDAALLTNGGSSNIVDKLLDSKHFFNEFKNSIKRMGSIGVLTGTNGEIRKNCRAVN